MEVLYTDEYLLNRLFGKLDAPNKPKAVLMPQIDRKNRKTQFVNFTAFCESIKRDEQTIKKFIEMELNTTSSVLPSGGLLIDRMDKTTTEGEMQIMLMRYMTEFILCHEKKCKSNNTQIVKDGRITYLVCNQCCSKKPIRQL